MDSELIKTSNSKSYFLIHSITAKIKDSSVEKNRVSSIQIRQLTLSGMKSEGSKYS